LASHALKIVTGDGTLRRRRDASLDALKLSRLFVRCERVDDVIDLTGEASR
jgi:hypothetical protein